MKRSLLALSLGWAACATPTPMPTESAGMMRAEQLLQSSTERTGNLRIDCTPDDAMVALDGVPVGLCSDFKGHRGVEVGRGTRRLAVSRTGYLSYESLVDTDGTRVGVTVSLAPYSIEGSKP